MSNVKLATIGLPVYNAETHLVQTLLSVVNQFEKDIQLIIVDDGSTDGSREIIKEFFNRYASIDVKIIHDGKNLGLPTRLNQIAEMCTTEYLLRMDADDIMLPYRVKMQLEFLKENPDVDLVGGGAYIIDIQNRVSGIRYAKTDMGLRSAIGGSLFIHPTVAGRTEWFQNHPYSADNRRSEDYELWIRTARSSKFANIQQPLIFYREVGFRHSNKYNKTMLEIEKTLSSSHLKDDAVYGEIIKRRIREIRIKRYLFNLASGLHLDSLLINSRSKKITTEENRCAQNLLRNAIEDNIL